MSTVEKTTPASKPPASVAPAPVKPTTKVVAKAAAKTRKVVPVVKPVATANAKSVAKTSAKPAAKAATAKPEKVKKPKMVRDSFTFPKAEYAILDGLKMRAAKLGKPVKKTELLRAGIKAIAAMQDTAFVAALHAVPSLKTGRPAKPKAD